MTTILWIALAAAYIAALVYLGMRTLANGHTVLFILGIFLPVLWVVGTLIAPRSSSLGVAQRP